MTFEAMRLGAAIATAALLVLYLFVDRRSA